MVPFSLKLSRDYSNIRVYDHPILRVHVVLKVLAMLVDWIGTKIFHRHVGETDVVITDAPEPEAKDGVTDKPLSASERLNMLQMAAYSGIAVALHNFPEGIATFISTMADPSFGPAMAFAIAMHNIPEGLAVAAPIKKATWRFMALMNQSELY